LIVVGVAYVWLNPIFGGKPDAASLKRIQASPHFNGKIFVNTGADRARYCKRTAYRHGRFSCGLFFPARRQSSRCTPMNGAGKDQLLPSEVFDYRAPPQRDWWRTIRGG